MTRHWIAATLCLGWALSLAGCAWNSPLGSSKSSNAYGEAAAQNAKSENFVTKSFKQAGAAMTPKPKVEKAPDPTSLSSKPGRMGPDLHLTAARQYENQGQFLKAEDHYRKAIEIAPKDEHVQFAYARLLHREGKIAEAVQVYDRVIKANPNSAVALNDLGLCFARNGQIEAARQALSRAVQLKPESKLYRNNLATVLVEANRFDEAFSQLVAAHGEAGANHNMGYLMQQHGDNEAAGQFFARAGQLDPSLAPAPAQVAPEKGRLQVQTVSQTRPAGETYYVGDRGAEAAPYRLPQQPRGAAIPDGSAEGAASTPYPSEAAPVMVDRS